MKTAETYYTLPFGSEGINFRLPCCMERVLRWNPARQNLCLNWIMRF